MQQLLWGVVRTVACTVLFALSGIGVGAFLDASWCGGGWLDAPGLTEGVFSLIYAAAGLSIGVVISVLQAGRLASAAVSGILALPLLEWALPQTLFCQRVFGEQLLLALIPGLIIGALVGWGGRMHSAPA